ncbi:hypothetical protein [Jiulongibacter sediminis]|uniref:Outer membrane protein beta-barrel domain-containing protein n=1 Tax=Jiulongibacter sediminis TaxID=1605367 RepID=A0A0N8HAC9_9BACT|nr:hypothetical protein [Jiulongibacter sediminis]KPM49820.1 hypothetical protein AFM12_04395 [Jiulongibacter sediminis]TBX26857.1 hypothetical protein TK44_04400 [Jiulongibacter sediminis]
MRYFLTLLFLSIFFNSKAQYVDKGSWYWGPLNANAVGSYKEYLDGFDKNTSKIGLVGGYLFNPISKSDRNSPIMVGGEFGLLGWGSDPVDYYQKNRFTNQHNYYWLNFVARWRPVSGASKINPFFDLFAGPAFVNSKVTELLGEGETRKVFGDTKTTKNYGLGAGIGIKWLKKDGDPRYVDLGLYFQDSEKITTTRRDSFYIIQNPVVGYDEIYHDKSVIKHSNFQIRLNLTNFL